MTFIYLSPTFFFSVDSELKKIRKDYFTWSPMGQCLEMVAATIFINVRNLNSTSIDEILRNNDIVGM